jgi:hypothetical protein
MSLFLSNRPAFPFVWSDGTQVSWSHQNKTLSVGPWAILEQILYMTALHYECNFNSADSSVVPDTLMDLFINLSTCYCGWSPRTRIDNICRLLSFESSHPIVNFSLPHTVISVPPVPRSVTTKTGSQIIAILSIEQATWTCIQCYHQWKATGNQQSADEGRLMSAVLFSDIFLFEVNWNCL